MRKGTLRVGLNTRKRDNYGYFDPLTLTNLSLDNQVSDDLNRVVINSITGNTLQLDLTNIKKALRTGSVIIVDGSLEEFSAPAIAPVKPDVNPTNEDMVEWNKVVHEKVIEKTVKKSKKK